MWEPQRGGAAAHLPDPVFARGGPLSTALALYHLSRHPSFVSGREIKKRKCLFGLHARTPPPVEPPTGSGAPTRSLVQRGWEVLRGIHMATGNREVFGASGRGLGG